ncbi:MAG: four helix bundle protein [Planctomycetes bacterium]|nr:four helix bundle protein [Planctomycetota bacterium]
MATYRSFEDLPVWQKAVDLADTLYDVTEREAFARRYSLRDQMERAALSVSSNIAEGFERGTREEFLAFLYIARGSCGELRSQLVFCHRRELIPSGVYGPLRELCLGVSKQLGAFAAYVRDSALKGQRHFGAKEKAAKQAEREREAFDAKVAEIVRQAREREKARAGQHEA